MLSYNAKRNRSIAETSTCADTLMDTLNAARIKHGKECDDAVSWLEKSLRKLNRGQGKFLCPALSRPSSSRLGL